jgi:hypothetical protein
LLIVFIFFKQILLEKIEKSKTLSAKSVMSKEEAKSAALNPGIVPPRREIGSFF